MKTETTKVMKMKKILFMLILAVSAGVNSAPLLVGSGTLVLIQGGKYTPYTQQIKNTSSSALATSNAITWSQSYIAQENQLLRDLSYTFPPYKSGTNVNAMLQQRVQITQQINDLRGNYKTIVAYLRTMDPTGKTSASYVNQVCGKQSIGNPSAGYVTFNGC
jgi:hypothetical protein